MAEEESDERHSQSVPTDIGLSDEETEEDFFVREAETPEDDDVIDGRRDIKWRIQRQVSVRDQSIPEKV